MKKLWTLLALAALLPTLACNDSNMLPHQLDGVWTSDDPRYAHAFLELSPVFMIIATGPENPISVQTVDRVTSEPTANGILYRVSSTDVQTRSEESMTLEFRAQNGGEIVFRGQDQAWKRSYSSIP
jgi:hypothetical protein